MALPLSDIRQLAEAAECWEEVSFNERSRVISFQHVDGCSRVNVYYTTGTIGTAIDHPVMGKTQLFRRNVTRNDLDRIFANPRAHTGKGYFENKKRKLSGGSSVWVSPSSPPSGSSSRSSVDVPDEIGALRTYLKYLQAEVDVIEDHIADCEESKRPKSVIASIEGEGRRVGASWLEREGREAADNARIQREEEKERARAAEKQRRRGMECDWELTHTEHIPKSMDDVKCVAIGEGGYVAVYDSGSSNYDNIPTELDADIDRAKNSNLGIVSIGPDSQYYLLKTNGKVFYHAHPGFGDQHDENPATPELVAFGPWGTYYIKFEDGTAAWRGDISESVRNIFNSQANVVCVWLGADADSNFVAYEENGVYKKSYNNLPHKMMCKYARKCEVRQMMYDAETENCFVRYSE